MRRLNLHDVYMLGKRVQPLTMIRSESKVREVAFELHFAREALVDIVKEASPLLDVSKRAAGSLIGAITGILPKEMSAAFKNDEKEIGYGAYDLARKLEGFESVLSNEMPSVPSFLVSKKGIYSTDDLIFRAENYFPRSILCDIPAQARKDICEAGKCLAFELPTACSFHLWRAVEDAMCAYYEALTGQTVEVGVKNRNWGGLIKALTDNGAEDSVTKFLDHIREEYRNPQMHPEEMVELDIALALFGAAASAINQIVMATQKAKAKKIAAQPSLALAVIPPS